MEQTRRVRSSSNVELSSHLATDLGQHHQPDFGSLPLRQSVEIELGVPMASARNPAMASSLSGGGEAVRPELLSMITQLISEGRSQPRSTRAALNVQAEPILASGPFEPAERAGAFQGAASKILNGVSEEMGVAQGDGTKDLGQSRGDESISQEHLTHLLVRVLVKGCIVPLTALSGDDMYGE